MAAQTLPAMRSFKTPEGIAIVMLVEGTAKEAGLKVMRAMDVPDGEIITKHNSGVEMAVARNAGKPFISFASGIGDGMAMVIFRALPSANDEILSSATRESLALLMQMAPLSYAAASANEASPSVALSPNIPTEPATKAPPALVGLWLGLDSGYSIDYTGSGSWGTTIGGYTFTSGGYFIKDVPEGTGFGDLGAIQTIARDAEQAGTFTVTPRTIELLYANGKTESLEYTKSGGDYDISFGNGYLSKKVIAPDGYRLNGTWLNKRLTNAGAGWISGQSYVHFTADGHFLYSNTVSLSNAAMTSINRSPSTGGTYSIADGAITLDYADGRKEVMSLFWETSPNSALWLDNDMYKPAN